jgi:glycosyltransferase involved in cell wall biosynthesis
VKILQIISGREVNGALVHVNLLSRQLAELGHEVTVLCRRKSWIWRRLSRSGIERVKSEMNRFPPFELQRVARWVKEQKFDVMHTHMSRAHFFGVLLKHLTGVPCVATAHASHWQFHWRFNDLVIANSNATRDFQVRYNRVRDKIVTIPCFIDLDRFSNVDPEVRVSARKNFGIHDNRPLVGIVSAIVKRKGHFEFIEALPKLVERFPDMKVAFIGQVGTRDEPYTRKLRRSLYQKKLFRRVIWVGRRNNIHELVRSFDVCAVPSLREPLGLCAVEAMTAGVPVAAANVGGLPEFVIPEKTGLLFDPKKPDDIADSITRLLNDQELRNNISVQAKELVHKQFCPRHLTNQISDALTSVVKNKMGAVVKNKSGSVVKNKSGSVVKNKRAAA